MKRYKILLLIVLVAGAAFVIWQQRTAPYRHLEGKIFGTYYNITYRSDQDLQSDILAALNSVDASLSMFNSKSCLSKINRNEDLALDSRAAWLIPRAIAVSEATDGAFDITVAPLVNAWGFGFKNEEWPSDKAVDSLRQFVGYKKISIKNGRLVKDDARTMLDLSAVAKGYGADAVAAVFDSNKVGDYMVEIGGDLVAKGKNSEGKKWRIGVARPEESSAPGEKKSYQAVLAVTDRAIATSGNYRNFHYKDGIRYAHTIDPRTGRPVEHEILSATIAAARCYEADAYATAVMVGGLDKAKKWFEKNKRLDAYIIYLDAGGKQAVWMTDGFKQYVQ
ncbi:MAG: FAD:protein FMN transferase [Prevotella sp.]|nr:FAD:protein FMN transferase [Prevotella sp.]